MTGSLRSYFFTHFPARSNISRSRQELVVGQILPETAASALGLAAVREGEDDNLAHWVAFIGKDHLNDLNGTGIACEFDWKGIVLDF